MRHALSHVLAATVAILAPIHALMAVVGFLILADLITGIWAAFKMKEQIRSSIMRRTISKVVVYQLAVISGFLVEQYMLTELLPVSKIVASVIGLVELKSILENGNKILGQDLFKTVLSKLGSDNDSLKEQIKAEIKTEVDKRLE